MIYFCCLELAFICLLVYILFLAGKNAAEMNNELRQKYQDIADRDMEIATLRQKQNKLQEEIEEWERTMSDRTVQLEVAGKEIAELNGKLTKKDDEYRKLLAMYKTATQRKNLKTKKA